MVESVSEWYTSDWHFGHVHIPVYQPNRLVEFEMESTDDIQKMNEMMVRQWNSQVSPDDTVWFLGDFAMGQIATTLEYARRLNGHKRLVLGNHDRPHPIMSRTPTKQQRWLEAYREVGFELIVTEFNTTIADLPVRLCHFPYTGDHDDEDRYPEWRPVDDGRVLVHGHVHGLWKVNGRMINVGIDAWNGKLLHHDEVAELVLEAYNG